MGDVDPGTGLLVDPLIPGRYSCRDKEEEKWEGGRRFLDALMKVELLGGVTGHIQFTEERWPRNIIYDIMNLQNQNFVRVGRWENVNKRLLIPYKPIYFEHSDTPPPASPRTLQGMNISGTDRTRKYWSLIG